MMHAHQHSHLVAELCRPEWDGQHADAVYAKLARPPKEFLAVSFMAQSKYDAKYRKARRGIVPVTDEYAAKFPGGVPGMPNLIRREWFDAAWKEARDGAA